MDGGMVSVVGGASCKLPVVGTPTAGQLGGINLRPQCAGGIGAGYGGMVVYGFSQGAGLELGGKARRGDGR
jgi:hypothetical protein